MSKLKNLAGAIVGSIRSLIMKKIVKVSHQRKNPARALAKWELISAHLPPEPGSLLDIGCNEGLFTRNAARMGWCAWGIDILDHVVNYATRMARKEGLSRVFFSTGTLTPENTKCLPKFDVIIMVSTFQEVCAEFGLEKGCEIFYNLLKSCGQRFLFEPSSVNSKYGPGVQIFATDNDPESIKKWVKGLVSRSPGWKVRYVGKTKYTAKEPYRFMFLIEGE